MAALIPRSGCADNSLQRFRCCANHIGDLPAIDLNPHTLVIVPQGQSVVIEMSTEEAREFRKNVGWTAKEFDSGTLQGFDAGDGEQRLEVISGYFSAEFGSCISLFGNLCSPIIEAFTSQIISTTSSGPRWRSFPSKMSEPRR